MKIRFISRLWLVFFLFLSCFLFYLVDTCIDQYKESRKANIEDADIPVGIRSIMDFIFSQSFTGENIPNLIGLSIECNRLDLLERALRSSSSISSSLYTSFHYIIHYPFGEDVRGKVLRLLQDLFVEVGDRYGVFLCLLHLQDYSRCIFLYIFSNNIHQFFHQFFIMFLMWLYSEWLDCSMQSGGCCHCLPACLPSLRDG